MLMAADEASNLPLQYGSDDFGEDMSIDYETLIHLLSEDLDPLQVGFVAVGYRTILIFLF